MLNVSKGDKMKKLTNSYLGGGIKYSNILYSEINLFYIKSNKVIVD